tara:strand:+ start:164 stop:268 length:105 start_codon:yes stop_codon:yes gene_type:complete
MKKEELKDKDVKEQTPETHVGGEAPVKDDEENDA